MKTTPKNKFTIDTLYSHLNEKLQFFLNLRYLPRWIVFVFDFFLICLANFANFLLITSLNLNYNYQFNFLQRYSVVLIVYLFFFVLFKTYAGIIRHSSFLDAIKLLLSTFSSLVFLLLLNFASSFVFPQKIFLNAGLIFSFVLSFIFLLVFRVFVKWVFEIHFKTTDSPNLINAVIFGCDANAIAVVIALRTETPTRFKIVGFIDHNNQSSTQRLFNLPILQFNKRIPVLMRSLSATALILSDKSLTKDEKLTIVDECLEYNLKVYTVPVISDWDDSNEISTKIKTFEIQDLLQRKPIILDNNAISKQLFNKTVLISGAAGSIGSEIVKQVIGFNPKRIILVDQAETPLHHLTLEIGTYFDKEKVCSIIADVRERDCIRDIFATYQPNVVFHAAAYKHVPLMEDNPSQAIFVNVQGTKNIADLSFENNIESFVMVSTDKAVNPSNVMGASKRIAEKYVQALHQNAQLPESGCTTRFITTRFGNVLGSNGSVVPLFTKQIAKGGPITITHPEIIRYFMTIPEACQLVLEASIMGKGGEIFIFDMGQPVKIIDLATKMIRLAGFTPNKEIKIEVVGLRPGEKLFEELLNDTAKTLPTHHEKITISQEVAEDADAILAMVKELIKISKSFSKTEIVSKMKEIVPEYKSMNSEFQILDK
ncbi:MAG: FlaA1/EpsC-like NDP-sugar epimerase [Flavobacterium sp.]